MGTLLGLGDREGIDMTGRYSRARPVRAAVILTASAITGFRALTSGTLGRPAAQ